MVSEPYFALEDLRVVAPDCLVARLPVEQPLRLEQGPIAAGEACRQLAILGLCAASMLNAPNERRHYEASGVYLRRNRAFAGKPVASGPLRGQARASLDEQRKASAQAQLFSDDDVLLYTLDVSYDVISQSSDAFACKIAPAISKMIDEATLLLRDRLIAADFRCSVIRLVAKANSLAFTGESLSIGVQYEREHGGLHCVRCSARSSAGAVVADMIVDLAV